MALQELHSEIASFLMVCRRYVVILPNGRSLKLSRGYKEHIESVLGRRF